jgi:predicted Zn finger-like uncharacterized protein
VLTRCPGCDTTFRVTPEQLKARGGKVRCGKCQSVFNALDTLADAMPAHDTPAATAVPPPPSVSVPAELPSSPPAQADSHPPATLTMPAIQLAGAPADQAPPDSEPPHDDDEIAAISRENVDILLEIGDESADLGDDDLHAAAVESDNELAHEPPHDLPDKTEDTEPLSPEAVRDTALAAGLVAARETTEVPGYNKWAEGAFTAPVSVSLPTSRPLWPFVVAALLLVLTLVGQVGHFYRAELAIAMPGMRPLLEAISAVAGSDIPLPRHAELVSIEASDLQIDPGQGGVLNLSATLKNRAAYAQAWPLLEITLTDAQDNALLRRVLQPAEYLPTQADPTVFPPNGETALRLWLEAKGITAAGYRLYVFYP